METLENTISEPGWRTRLQYWLLCKRLRKLETGHRVTGKPNPAIEAMSNWLGLECGHEEQGYPEDHEIPAPHNALVKLGQGLSRDERSALAVARILDLPIPANLLGREQVAGKYERREFVT